MKKFNYQQKISMLRILLDIVNADGVVDARELFLFNKMKKKFRLTDDDLPAVRTRNSLLSLLQVKEMDEEQKKSFAEIMSKMIVIDEDINVNELAIYNIVTEFCNIGIGFEESLPDVNIEAYSHS